MTNIKHTGKSVNSPPNLFGEPSPETTKRYRPVLAVSENGKGVLDVDTVKGCTFGMMAYPGGGCYGECYAYKNARTYGIDFTLSVSRQLTTHKVWVDAFCAVKNHAANWYRVGTAGDPSHDWGNTIQVCESLKGAGKIPVIITKHWVALTDDQIARLRAIGAVVNTSTSGLDSDWEMNYRVGQILRLISLGVHSICRVVTCEFGDSDWAKGCQVKQDFLLSMAPVIDNPLRATQSNPHVLNGDIKLTLMADAVGGGKYVSLHDPKVYLGTCGDCPDQCGAPQPSFLKEK